MLADRLHWNEKYRRQDSPREPAEVVRDFFALAPGRRALDVAAGNGRNALFLAEQGFAVDAVDIAEEGLSRFAGKNPRVRAVCADLDLFDIPRERYDLIVNVLYVNRRLFPGLREGLRPGGVLIFESLLEPPDPAAATGRRRRDYYLRENELLHSFLALHVLSYREFETEGEGEGPRRLASLVARRRGGG
ncbi:MAG: methyltransferase domain-containing protein [Desulfobacterales bacterium]